MRSVLTHLRVGIVVLDRIEDPDRNPLSPGRGEGGGRCPLGSGGGCDHCPP